LKHRNTQARCVIPSKPAICVCAIFRAAGNAVIIYGHRQYRQSGHKAERIITFGQMKSGFEQMNQKFAVRISRASLIRENLASSRPSLRILSIAEHRT